jgi:hypothetical protein
VLVTLKHLFVSVVLFSLGLVLGSWVANKAVDDDTISAVIAIVVGVLAVLFFSWPVYRLLSMRPIALPKCPHCGKRHGNYQLSRSSWPDAVLVCVQCKKPLRILLESSIVPKGLADISTATISWPRFIGRWNYTVVPEHN